VTSDNKWTPTPTKEIRLRLTVAYTRVVQTTRSDQRSKTSADDIAATWRIQRITYY